MNDPYKEMVEEYINPKDLNELKKRACGIKGLIEPEENNGLNPIIGTDTSIWLHPGSFKSNEDALNYIKKYWKNQYFYIDEKDYFGIISRDFCKRYRKSDNIEDYSNIDPFIQIIIDNKKDFLYDYDYIRFKHEYTKKGTSSKLSKFDDVLN